MAKHLDVPPVLQHLIEKRESGISGQGDRRRRDRRETPDMGPLGVLFTAENVNDIPECDRRKISCRRTRGARRRANRRKTGSA